MEAAAVLEDVFSAIPCGKAEIENSFAVPMAHAAGTRAEAVDEPREFCERGDLQDSDTVVSAFDPTGAGRSSSVGLSYRGAFAHATLGRWCFRGSHNLISIIARGRRVAKVCATP